MLKQIRSLLLSVPLACLLFFSALSALAAPASPQFTIPAKQRIVIYVADG